MRKKIALQNKEQCVQYAIDHPERSLKELAEEFDVDYSNLLKWVRQARQSGQVVSPGQMSADKLEIQRLKKRPQHANQPCSHEVHHKV